MPIFNVCHKCGAKVKVKKPRNPAFAKWLENTNQAICSVCSPSSAWRRVQ